MHRHNLRAELLKLSRLVGDQDDGNGGIERVVDSVIYSLEGVFTPEALAVLHPIQARRIHEWWVGFVVAEQRPPFAAEVMTRLQALTADRRGVEVYNPLPLEQNVFRLH